LTTAAQAELHAGVAALRVNLISRYR